MSNIKNLLYFLQHFYRFVKLPTLLKLTTLHTLQGVLQGAGILLIIPLLQLLGDSGITHDGGGKVVEIVKNVFSSLSIPLTIYTVIGTYIFIASFTEILTRYQSVLSLSLMQKYTSHLRVKLYDNLLHSKWGFLQSKRRSLFTHTLTQDISQIGGATFNSLNIFSNVFIILFNTIVACYIHLPFTISTILFAGFLTLISKSLFAKALHSGKKQRGFHQTLFNNIAESLGGLKSIKSHGQEDKQVSTFQNSSEEMVDQIVSFSKVQAYTQGGHGVLSVVVLGIYFLIAIEFFQLEVSSLLVLLFIFSRLVPRFSRLVSSWQQIINMIPAFEGVITLEKEMLESQESKSSDTNKTLDLQESITLNEISYSYNEDNSFELSEIDLTIPAKSQVSFVGLSGSGKTTIADIITGLLSPKSGTVSIDGNLLTPEIMQEWKNSISYVTQESYFLNDSIRNNLMFDLEDVPEERLWEVLELSAIGDFVKELPDGLDTIIGDRGTLLSGGERQRLSIAKAILKDPALLILDEATSALDYKNESLIYDLIRKLHGKTTVITIAHRLSTIKDSDTIFVLDNGSLVEQGNWSELSKKTGGYLQELITVGELQ